jgi:hypothetical protein
VYLLNAVEKISEKGWDSGRIKGRNDTNKKPKEGVLSSLHLLFTLILLDLVIHSPFSFLYQTFSIPSLTAPIIHYSKVFCILRLLITSLLLFSYACTFLPHRVSRSPSHEPLVRARR